MKMQSGRSRLLGDLIEGLPDDTKRISMLRYLGARSASTPIVEVTRAVGLDPSEGARVLDEAAEERLIEISPSTSGHMATLTSFGREVLAKADQNRAREAS
jgi:hypothetical protein